jgi:hypothetical protein
MRCANSVFFVAVISLALPTAGSCRDWATAQDGSAAIEQDGARLNIICDTEHGHALHPDSLGKILIFLKEPRANWVKSEKVEVRTAPDGGSSLTTVPSHGLALSPTSVVIENDATWDLSDMGNAKKTFTITAGAYSRTYSASNLKATVAPVLEKCGDHW